MKDKFTIETDEVDDGSILDSIMKDTPPIDATLNSMVPSELLDRLVEIDERRADIKAELKDLDADRACIEERILEAFSTEGITSIKRPRSTIYLHKTLWAVAKDGDKDRAIKALEACAMDDLITRGFNTNQVSAIAREHDKEGIDLPKEFLEGFDVNPTFKIRTKRR